MSAIAFGVPYTINLPGDLRVGGILNAQNANIGDIYFQSLNVSGNATITGSLSAGNISTSPGNGVIPQAGADGTISVGFIPTTGLQISFRQGTDAERAVTLFAAGEPVYATDTKRMWLGDGATIGGLSEFALPAQAGKSGWFLTTNGTGASWFNITGLGYSFVPDPIDPAANTITIATAGNSILINADGTTVSNTLAADNLQIGGEVAAASATFGGPVNFKNYAAASLPPAASYPYSLVFVNDATLNAAAGLGMVPTGGGSNKVPVYSDGSNWIIL